MIPLIASALLLAAAQNYEPGKGQPSQAVEFGGKMLVVDNPEAFWKAWEGPTPPHINTVSTIALSRPVQAMLVFHGCRAGPDGNCRVKVTFSMTGPTGKPYGETLTGYAWRGPPAPGFNLQASEASMGFELEPEDPLGQYLMQATLTDEIGGKTINLSEKVDAVVDAPVQPVS